MRFLKWVRDAVKARAMVGLGAALAVAVALLVVAPIALVVRAVGDDQPPRFAEVQAPVADVVRGEPDAQVKLPERVLRPATRPVQVATAPKAARVDVARFCGAAGWVVPPRPAAAAKPTADGSGPSLPAVLVAMHEDTSAAEPPATEDAGPQLLLRSLAYGRGELQAWGPRSDGDLWNGRYRVSGGFTARVDGDSLIVQRDRFAEVKKWGERLLWAGIGAGAGYVAGSAGN
jgi:hypothetical protein